MRSAQIVTQKSPITALKGRFCQPKSVCMRGFCFPGLQREAVFQGVFMANVVVIGSQWGDEGKGKIVDWLSERADVVVRFQGGHNAGHTLVIDGKVSYKLSLLPSGVVRPGKLAVIGNGVVIDPHALVSEIDRLAAQGVVVNADNLRIADNATLILSLHRELDALREDAASNSGTKIGTTRRGIGPAYEDKVGRRAIRVMDLANLETLPAKVDRLAHPSQRAAPRAGPAGILGRDHPRGTDLSGRADPAVPRDRLAASGQEAPPRRADPVRGRAGHAARCRPRHLSVRHLLEHDCRPGRGGFGSWGLGR
jgi:hypothetical protein